jgi:hypothetical protein
MTTDHVHTLDESTPDYYGSDVSSVGNIPDGFNEISREEPYEESDTSSATDGLTDDFNDRAPDDHIGPDPEAIMQSVGEGGGGDRGPDGALTDVTGAQSAYAPDSEGSTTSAEGSSSASDSSDAPEGDTDDARVTMDSTKPELQKAAQDANVDDSGTKQEIYDRLPASVKA